MSCSRPPSKTCRTGEFSRGGRRQRADVALKAMTHVDDLRKSRGLHSVRAFGHGPVHIGPCLRVLRRVGTLLARGEDDGYP